MIVEIISFQYEVVVNTITAAMKKEKNETEMVDCDRKNWLRMVTISEISRTWIVSYGVEIVILLFGTVWYLDPGFLTFISLNGLYIATGDYFGPKLLPYILSNDWSEEKESRYSKFCRNFAWLVCRLKNEYNDYMDWQDKNHLQTLYFQ